MLVVRAMTFAAQQIYKSRQYRLCHPLSFRARRAGCRVSKIAVRASGARTQPLQISWHARASRLVRCALCSVCIARQLKRKWGGWLVRHDMFSFAPALLKEPRNGKKQCMPEQLNCIVQPPRLLTKSLRTSGPPECGGRALHSLFESQRLS